MLKLLGRIDRLAYRMERAIVIGGLFVMSTVVFVDVVHRTFADPESRVARWLAAGVALFGEPGRAEAIYPTMRDWVTPPVLFVFFVILAYVGVRWRAGASERTRSRSLRSAVAIVLLTALIIRLMIWALPNGLVWAQSLALVLTLWVGFAGASMCTYDGRHLRVEVADRLWPESTKRVVGAVSNGLTAAAVLALFWLSLYFVQGHYANWAQTDGYGGLVEGLRLMPRWVAFAVLPLSFLVMGLRFLASAAASVMGLHYGRVGGNAIQAMLSEASEGVTVLTRNDPAPEGPDEGEDG